MAPDQTKSMRVYQHQPVRIALKQRTNVLFYFTAINANYIWQYNRLTAN